MNLCDDCSAEVTEMAHFDDPEYPVGSVLCPVCFGDYRDAAREREPQAPGTHWIVEEDRTTIIGPDGVTVEQIHTMIDVPPVGTPWPSEEENSE
jgi:hypothetical protein